jgi:hypothetical protein
LSYLYGFLVASIALGILVLTAWAVDRLDAADRGSKRVPWRPWYRTAIAAAISLLTGLMFGAGMNVFWAFPATFLLVLVLQLWTASGTRLHVLETLAMSLSMYGGIAMIHWLYPEAPNPDGFRDYGRSFIGCSSWFLLFILVGIPSVIIRGIVSRSIRASD